MFPLDLILSVLWSKSKNRLGASKEDHRGQYLKWWFNSLWESVWFTRFYNEDVHSCDPFGLHNFLFSWSRSEGEMGGRFRKANQSECIFKCSGWVHLWQSLSLISWTISGTWNFEQDLRIIKLSENKVLFGPYQGVTMFKS